MLQVLNAAVLPAAATEETEVLAAQDFAGQVFVLADVLEFSEQPAAERPPSAPLEQPDAAQAEQWLLNVLGQQQVQVQALESESYVLGQSAADELALELEWSMPSRQPLAQVFVNEPAQGLERGGERRALAQSVPALPVNLGLNTALALDAHVLADALPSPSVDGVESIDAGRALLAPAVAPPERALKLEGSQAKWGEQMMAALRENVELQLQQRVQSTTIRLDPPELGSLEIYLSHENGRVNVQISAAHGEVARLLQQTSERLRHELLAQNFVEVNVEVGQQQGESSQQRHARWAQPAESSVSGNALQLEQASALQLSASDVLVTV